MSEGTARPSGELGLRVIHAADERAIRDRFDRIAAAAVWPARELSLSEVVHFGLPRRRLDDRVNAWRLANFRHLMRGVRRVLMARSLRLSNFYGSLYLTKIDTEGEVLEYGLASMRVVTDAGVGFIVDAFQNTAELETMKYHGLGTGTTAELVSQTALTTELTTAYNPDGTRATGTTTENGANVYRTVATNTVDAAAAVTEHGIFSSPTSGAGVLLDRSQFAAVNLASGDSLQSTYDFTINSGG